jgi:8-oxo-dGTP diphosphatase
VVGDLLEHRPVTRRVNDLDQHIAPGTPDHQNSSTRLHMTAVESTDLGRNPMTEDHRYSVSVAGVIVDDEGRALIIQRRDNGHWEPPPGGILEHGETIEDGLRREVYEETGLKVEPGPLNGVCQNMQRNIVALVFRCTAAGGLLGESDEAAAFRCITAVDATSVMTQAYAVRVLDALAYADKPRARPHDGTSLL